jgi:hypothetical protein
MERLKAEKRRFEFREKTLFGFVRNALSLTVPGMQRTGKGFLPMLFNLLASGEERRQLLHVKQELAKKALSEKQFGRRKVRAKKVKLIRDAHLAALARAYDIQKQALEQRHAREIATQKAEWQALSIERRRLWAQWEVGFGPRPRQTMKQGTGCEGGSQIPGRPRGQFREVSQIPVKKAAPENTEKFLGAGKPVTRRAKPNPSDSPQPGYKQRRSAAERKADGSYKPRQRRPKLGL